MWKNNRPEGWENKNPCVECPNKVEDEYGLFCDLACGLFTRYVYKEAGADAMLEALKATGSVQLLTHPIGVKTVGLVYFYSGEAEKGWLVFIPEEKV